MSDLQPNHEEAREVPVEVVSSRGEPVKTSSELAKKTFFHPWSGLIILGVDWLAFGVELPTGFLITPIVSILAYIVTYTLVKKIQLEQNGDNLESARRKALIGAIAAAIPIPITGTVVGVAILMLSGLPTSVSKVIWRIANSNKKS
jgi:hypothetical protein